MNIYGHFFLYNLCTFAWTQHSCKVYMVFALDLKNSVIKTFKCISKCHVLKFYPAC